MQQDLGIRHARAHISPHHRPSPRRVYTPTPDGFERFLRECLVLARGAGTPPRVHGLWAWPGAKRPPRRR